MRASATHWRAAHVNWFTQRGWHKRYRHQHARACAPILSVGPGAHSHHHTDDRTGGRDLGAVPRRMSWPPALPPPGYDLTGRRRFSPRIRAENFSKTSAHIGYRHSLRRGGQHAPARPRRRACPIAADWAANVCRSWTAAAP